MARLYGFSALAGKPVPHCGRARLRPRKRLFRTVKEPLSQRHMHHIPTQNHNCLIIREMCTNKESGNIVLKFRLQLIVTLMDFCIGKARNDKRDGKSVWHDK